MNSRQTVKLVHADNASEVFELRKPLSPKKQRFGYGFRVHFEVKWTSGRNKQATTREVSVVDETF